MKKSVAALVLASTVAIPATGLAETPSEQAVIVNHKTWTDTDGNPILAHDSGITRFWDTFSWYGTSDAGNPKGRFGMMPPKPWNGVLVSSSTNLVDWTCRAPAVTRPDEGFGNLGTSGRPHVVYNEKTKKHVMWYWLHLHFSAATRFAPHFNGRSAIRIDSLTDDYLTTNQEGACAIKKGCESPAMIKHAGASRPLSTDLYPLKTRSTGR